ncbi:MAG: hypothetical protein NW203_08985 [Hyphomonadaceae bacterium]|nr:hypothetical protein [Hyphomonadaceae bacterium]
MRPRPLLLSILFACAPIAASEAQPPREAVQMYSAGDFVGAANAAGTADAVSLAFAARSLLAACVAANDPAALDALLRRAEASASAALALEPASVEARLQLALAYGIRGKRASLSEAFRHRYAARGRNLINEAISLAPSDPRAHALLGAWHFEVIRRGGRAGAIMYGARIGAGSAAFERAMRLAPDDPLIALHYGLALIQNDPRNAPRAAELLRAAAEAPARDALDRMARNEARRIGNLLAEAGPRAAAEAARQSLL